MAVSQTKLFLIGGTGLAVRHALCTVSDVTTFQKAEQQKRHLTSSVCCEKIKAPFAMHFGLFILANLANALNNL